MVKEWNGHEVKVISVKYDFDAYDQCLTCTLLTVGQSPCTKATIKTPKKCLQNTNHSNTEETLNMVLSNKTTNFKQIMMW